MKRKTRATEARFRQMWEDLRAVGDPTFVYDELVHAYGSLNRRYHTLEHVGRVLCELDAAGPCEDRPAVEMALWFHDVVYDTRRKDNEAASARWLENAGLQAKIPAARVARAAAHVQATAHGLNGADDSDTAVVLDCDLAILAAPKAMFDRYDQQIREEYAWVSEASYRRERALVLRSFLARQRIFRSPSFADYENPAKRNITRALRRLGAA